MNNQQTSIQLTLTLLSPTCIAQRPTSPGQFIETLTYLTGTVIRGGIATCWLAGRRYEELDSKEQEQFRSLFLSGAVRFGNAWPVYQPAKNPAEYQTLIVPRTAWTPKDNSGWCSDEDKKKQGAGVRDALAVLLNETSPDWEQWEDWDRLGQDFVSKSGGRWSSVSPRRRLISRTALLHSDEGLSPSIRGVAADGQLFQLEALETGQSFRCVIDGPADLMGDLQEHVLQSDTILSIGQARSRGLGQVAVRQEGEPLPDVRSVDSLKPAVQAFTQRVSSHRTDATDWYYLPITLDSDIILRDHYLLPSSSGNPTDTLWRYFPAADPALQQMALHTAVQSTRWLGGWDELRRLPRPPQLAVQQGSVWVYRVPARDDLLDAALRWWLQAEADGVGERCSEGFGRVRLLHPVHMEDQTR
jgi:CRISPR-associated Csx10 family RAMP protein